MLLVCLAACEEDVEPEVTYIYGQCYVNEAEVLSTTATLEGAFEGSMKTTSVKEFGFLYSTSSALQISDSVTHKVLIKEPFSLRLDYVSGAEGGQSYIANLTGLEPATKYYYCLFISNGKNVVKVIREYEEVNSFTTKALTDPVLGVINEHGVGERSLDIYCHIINDGGHEINACGFSYKKHEDTDSKYLDREAKKDTTSFSVTIDELTPGASYDVYPYVMVGSKKVKGVVKTIEMLGFEAPEVTTLALKEEDYGSGYALLQGNVINEGASSIIERGFYYSQTSTVPTIKDSVIIAVKATGSTFNARINKLEPNTLYYYRAYATNETKTGTGEVKSFRTKDLVTLSVSDPSMSSSTSTAISLYATIRSGAEEMKEMGFCYSSTRPLPEKGTDPSIQIEKMEVDNRFAGTITDLEPETEYYVRAYVVGNDGNIIYSTGSQKMSTIVKEDIQFVLKFGAKTSTSFSVSIETKITGNISIREKGFLYSEANEPSWSEIGKGTKKIEGYGSTVSGLKPGATYYVCAYALITGNENEPRLSQVQSVTTLSLKDMKIQWNSVPSAQIKDGVVNVSISASASMEDYAGKVTGMTLCYSTTNQSPTLDDEKIALSDNGSCYNKVVPITGKGIIYMRIYAKGELNGVIKDGYSTVQKVAVNLIPGEDDNDSPNKEN